MQVFDNHKSLFSIVFLFFAVLTLLVAIVPALSNQKNNAILPGTVELTEAELRGKLLYIDNGCVGCHTQQVRNIDMDKVWGNRPGISADYAGIKRIDFWRNTATLMGTERTGPDLTSIGSRQPSQEWHLLHLFQPRAVVKESIMPAYPWLFQVKQQVSTNDVVVTVPKRYQSETAGFIVATQDALDLVAYLKSLKQVPLPKGGSVPSFLYKNQVVLPKTDDQDLPDSGQGATLYASNCQSCHQQNGEGIPGAFPPLKGSPIVNNDNPTMLIDIIVNGYDAREQYAVMPAIGTTAGLNPDEIASIANHERSSWGNNARKVTKDEVEQILKTIQKEQ